jgi:hypothetical protein
MQSHLVGQILTLNYEVYKTITHIHTYVVNQQILTDKIYVGMYCVFLLLVCSVLYILFSSCQLAFSDYPN